LCLAYSYFGKQMPEIVTIVQLGVLPALGTEKEAGKGGVYHIFLVGNAQALPSELGACQPKQTPRVSREQLLRGSGITHFDPADQLRDRPGRAGKMPSG
jgi:hypothetical protein